MYRMNILLRLLLILQLLLALLPPSRIRLLVVEGCNRFYSTTRQGKRLVRINRRTGRTKDVGKWKYQHGGDRVIDTLEWNFPNQVMHGFMLDSGRPLRSQRVVRINRQKPRGARTGNNNLAETGRFDLKGLAVDGNDVYYTHSLNDRTLFTININTGALSELFFTGLENVLDLGYRIESDEIWAVNGTSVFMIDVSTGTITELQQRFVAQNPDNRIVAIAFNPVMHTPMMLTSGEQTADAETGQLTNTVLPAVYWYILGNDTAVMAGETGITNGPPAGGTLQCKRRVFTSSPSSGPSGPTISPQPTRPPFISDQPSESPTTGPSLTAELEPFFLVLDVDPSSTLNETALEESMETYFFDIYSGVVDNLVAVDLILLVRQRGRPALTPRKTRRRLTTATTTTTTNTTTTLPQLSLLSGNATTRAAKDGAQQRLGRAAGAATATGGTAAAILGGERGGGKQQQQHEQKQQSQSQSSQPQQQQKLQKRRRLEVISYRYRVILVFADPTSVSRSQVVAVQVTAVNDVQAIERAILATPGIGDTTSFTVLDAMFIPEATSQPSLMPSGEPSEAPSKEPSALPSSAPSRSRKPTTVPIPTRSVRPSAQPSPSPSRNPSMQPTHRPTSRFQPSAVPTHLPTRSVRPSSAPA